jgi:RNA polymerase sigma factor (sigma-70 family)
VGRGARRVVDPARTELLHGAIERHYADILVMAENLAWKKGLANTRGEVKVIGEEIVQEVVRRSLEGASTFDPARAAGAWLYGIALNVTREWIRTREQERKGTIVTTESHSVEDGRPGDAMLLEHVHDLASEQDRRVVELLDLVSPAERQILTLRYVDRLTGRDLAAALGISEGAARVRLNRALTSLRAEYRRAESL